MLALAVRPQVERLTTLIFATWRETLIASTILSNAWKLTEAFFEFDQVRE